MKPNFLTVLFLPLFFCGNIFAQTSTIDLKKANVELESIKQRYDFKQADVLLQKQIEGLKGISQHDTYERLGELLALKDTVHGTALLIADGARVYLVTYKHLIKATENEGNNLESINELITIRTNIGGKISNPITLMNLSEDVLNKRAFVFSDDATDLGIISFQKASYKKTIIYLKQMGCVPASLKEIKDNELAAAIGVKSSILFPLLHKLQRNEVSPAFDK